MSTDCMLLIRGLRNWVTFMHYELPPEIRVSPEVFAIVTAGVGAHGHTDFEAPSRFRRRDLVLDEGGMSREYLLYLNHNPFKRWEQFNVPVEAQNG